MDVPETLHQGAVRLDGTEPGGVGLKPLAEGSIERFVFGLCDLAGLFNEVRVRTETDSFHDCSVHQSRAVKV